MEEEKGNYLVIWHMLQKIKKRGVWNRISGKSIARLKPVMQRYNSEEIAKYGYKNIKNNGGIRPYLLKVIKE